MPSTNLDELLQDAASLSLAPASVNPPAVSFASPVAARGAAEVRAGGGLLVMEEEVELKVRDPLSVVILLFWLTGLIVRCVLV